MGKDGLIMKYFILKPKGTDVYAKASRAAMLAYAGEIEKENHPFAVDIVHWVAEEEDKAKKAASEEGKEEGS